MQTLRTCLSIAGMALTLLIAWGCGSAGADYSLVELHKVGGKVTLDGQPLVGAVVMFETPDRQFAYGLTDSGGRYTLQIDSEKSGVTPGQKSVRISTAKSIPGLNAAEGQEGGEAASEGGTPASQKPVERVPAKYNVDSTLSVNVTASAEFNFDLTSN